MTTMGADFLALGAHALRGHASKVSNVAPIVAGLRIQTSAYGRPIPRIFGKTRVAANLLWYGDFTAIPHTSSQTTGSGGKGGGGSSTRDTTTFTYTAAVLLLIGRGQIGAVPKVWREKDVTTLAALGFSLFAGASGQTAYPYLTTNHPSEALNYRSLAYVAASALDLGDSGQLLNHTFEVEGLSPFSVSIRDANPKDVLVTVAGELGIAAGKIGDLTAVSNYCVANGLFVSPAYTEQRPGIEILAELTRIANAEIVDSEGVIKVVPYSDQAATGNGATYTPSVTPIFEFNDDDFLAAPGEEPVQFEDDDAADIYNIVKVKFYNRLKDYAEDVVEAQDDDHIALYGPKPMPDVIQLYAIVDPAVARTVAQTELQKQLYYRRNYRFAVGPGKADLLEPMDVISLTRSSLGLAALPVRIREIAELQEGERDGFEIVARECPAGPGAAALYTPESGNGYAVNFNADPGDVNTPLFIEAPVILTTSGLELWIAASGASANWGGCQVWVAVDPGGPYKQAGIIFGPARHGVLTAALPSNADPDTTDTLKIDISASRGQLISGTQRDADSGNTLCWVDGEFMAFKTATLTGTGKYDLTYLRRGLYHLPIASHMAGTPFARLDGAIFKYPYTSDRIGSPVYVKFRSFNIFGGALRDIAAVPAYQYNIRGTALLSTLRAPTNVTSKFIGGYTNIVWTPVDDFRNPDYEVRQGPTFQSAQKLGRIPATNPAFITMGDGTYYIASHYRTPDGTDVYSSPVSMVLAGSVLTKNVLVSYNEPGTGWSGTLGGDAAITAEGLVLRGGANILAEANILAVTDLLRYGGVSLTGGSYTIPIGHEVDIQRVAPCNVVVSYAVAGINVMDDLLRQPNVLTVNDFLGDANGAKITITPQIRVADASGIFGPWTNYTPGAYSARKFDMRLQLATTDPQVYPAVSKLNFLVDVPDKIETGTNVVLDAVGTSFMYATPFNGGPNGAAKPNLQFTILNAQAGDDIVITGDTVNGFTARVFNGGSGVARNVNWVAQGY